MKELDVLLVQYIDEYGATLSEDEWSVFESLLSENDMDLYAWFTGRNDPGDPQYARLVEIIRRRNPA